ncbi:hypothetical protein BZR70_24265, partial [Salmonella enterica subsp. enterica serovar Enteritidis]|nr:hypothetical protein [Salmonella enterica subsp. enterica serovar Enteritidis]
MRFSTFALALCAALPSTHATSGEIAEQAAKAEQLLEMGSGKRDAAIEAWQNAQDAYWKKLRFQVRNVQLVNSVRGYGVYEPRADSIYKVGDTIQIYMEPVGYGFIANDQGGVSVGFSALTSVQSKSGEPMRGEFTAPVVAGAIPSHR